MKQVTRKTTAYKGFQRIDFSLNGRAGSVTFPETAVRGNRWIWRTEFLGEFDKADMELVEQGWHLAYYKISDMYGCPKAVELMSVFHDFIVKEFGLHGKTVLFGFSRGGLYAVNYAVAYPGKVESLYLDAPVIDILSWPKKHSAGELWTECLECYGFDEAAALNYSKTQANRAETLAKNKIPVLVVAGDADLTVPYDENAGPFVERYRETHGDIQVLLKNGCGHHPHSLDDVSPIVEFVSKKQD